jgi:PPOX class probable F420-dependent enzyme
MPKQRDRVRMTEDEVTAMLAAGRKVQLATIGPDGYPHLVTMYYTLVDGKIAFWTYRTSQKALNLARDPRISCLVETGEGYFDLRGVQIQGVAETITEPDAVYQIGLGVATAMAGGGSADPGAAALEGVSDYVTNAARKRYAYLVSPVRVISWDHTKLVGQ